MSQRNALETLNFWTIFVRSEMIAGLELSGAISKPIWSAIRM